MVWLIVAAAALGGAAADAVPCERLPSLSLPEATITRAESIGAGAFRTYETVPAFCQVEGTLTPSRDSAIGFEVWLPAAGWNGKCSSRATARGADQFRTPRS
jgi:hypothetical protein